MPQRCSGTIVRSSVIAVARWRAGMNVSIARYSRVWSRAVMCDSPQIGAGAKRVMCARCASRATAASPTRLRIVVAALLSEWRIIRDSSARAFGRSGRSRTPARLR
jgi:hypothetical protein